MTGTPRPKGGRAQRALLPEAKAKLARLIAETSLHGAARLLRAVVPDIGVKHVIDAATPGQLLSEERASKVELALKGIP